MEMYDILTKKKRKEALTAEEIDFFARGYLSGEIPDYQASALMMAVVLNGMTDEETVLLTGAIESSGDVLDLSHLGDLTVDKHSTGGVGDKTTPILAPIVAAAGGRVAKMSGRGLGHTGGTIDKLESIPGFRTAVSPEELDRLVGQVGICVTAQSGDLAPLDKKLYALRDVTATVDSMPLISSSIMSKKLAAGTKSIVLDVKCGRGSFMKTPADAKNLAETMVKIGKAHGRRTAAVITNMDLPLGHAIGNAIEVCEAIEVLRGGGPEDLKTVCLTLATLMVEFSCKISHDEAEKRVNEALCSGKAFEKFCEWIREQGGDDSYAKDTSLFGEAKYSYDVICEKDGYILSCDAEKIGLAAMTLGAGRTTKDSVIDPRAGVILLKKPSDKVCSGDTIARILTEKPETIELAKAQILSAIEFTNTPLEKPVLIHKIIV